MEFKLELVLVPVTDVDRAKAFYTNQAGFYPEVDTMVGADMRVVQVTPPGSACSVGFGTDHGRPAGLGAGPAPGRRRYRGGATAALARDRGHEVKHLESGAWVPGPDPRRANYQSFADFADPDGNVWLLQEVNRAEPRDGG